MTSRSDYTDEERKKIKATPEEGAEFRSVQEIGGALGMTA